MRDVTENGRLFRLTELGGYIGWRWKNLATTTARLRRIGVHRLHTGAAKIRLVVSESLDQFFLFHVRAAFDAYFGRLLPQFGNCPVLVGRVLAPSFRGTFTAIRDSGRLLLAHALFP